MPGRNVARENSHAQLENAIGIKVIPTEKEANCDTCARIDICDTVMQEESHAVTPGTRLCKDICAPKAR